MSMRNLRFDLSDEQKEKRHQLAKELYDTYEEIPMFLKEKNCSWDFYEQHVTQFKRWVEGKRKAENYSKEALKEDSSRGLYIDLEYDSEHEVLIEVVRKVPYVSQLEEDFAFLKNYEVFDLPESLANASFDRIEIEKEAEENPAYIKAVKEVLSFVKNDETGCYLHGDLGVGKSYLAACVSNQYAKNNRKVVYAHVPSLLNYLKQQFSNPIAMEEILWRMRTVTLLVLDDLGAEPITPWGRDEILLSILNDRLENKRKTIITSNLKPELLLPMYQIDTRGVSDEIRARRLVDRILSLTKPCEIIGKNRRHS